MTKHYPLYGHKLPKELDIEMSDRGNCIYVTMDNKEG